MMTPQTVMGLVLAGLCAAGLWRDRWFFEQTRKGRRLADWFGEVGGLRLLRIALACGIVFGLLLAADVIRPMHW